MPTVDPHKRLETIREYIAGSPEGREIAGLSRDEKVEWTHHLLDQIRYEALSKTEKGLVRQYLQSVTGYSRAQVERYISAYRKLVADDKRPTLTTAQTPVTPEPAAAAREVSATPVRLAQGVSFGIPLLLGATVLVLAVSLAKVSSQLPASLLALTRTNSAVSSSSSSVSPAPRPAASSSPTTTKISLAAAQTRPFTAIEGRIEIRRAARISAVPSPIAKHMIVPTRAQYKTQLTATLATISGSPAEGQIVVFKNGKAVWGDLPTELQSAPAGLLTGVVRKPSSGGSGPSGSDAPAAYSSGGGGRGGGGGGGSGGGGNTTNVTNITNTTTTTGLDQTAADDLYVNESGDSMDGALNILVAGLGFNVVGTASGSHLHAEHLLTSSGTLIVEGISTLNGALTVHAAMSGSSLTVTNLKNCDTIDTNAAGVLTCGTDDGGGAGITTTTGDPRYVNVSGDSMTGGLLITSLANGAAPTIDAGILLEVIGTASGRQILAMDQLRSSGSLSVQGTSRFKGTAIFGSTLTLNGVTYTFPGGDGSASGKVLKTNGAGQLAWSSDIDTDTDTNTVTAVGRGLGLTSGVLTLNATITGSLVRFTNLSGSTVFAKNTLASSGSLKVLGTASGGQLHASNQLRSSGTLSIQGITNLKGAAIFGSTLTLNGVTYTFPGGDGSASGKVLKTNGAGQLAWSSDIDTDANTTYAAAQGLTLNGANAFSLSSSFSGSALEIMGTASGRILHAQDSLTSSGILVLEEGQRIVLNGTSYLFPTTGPSSSGKVLKTDATGNLSWSSDIDTDANTTYTAGEGLSLTGTAFSRIATMTGTSLEIFGTASGRQVYAADVLRSSGSLSVQGAATFKNSSFRLLDSSFANCTALETVDGVLTCGSDGGGTSFLAGQGINLNGANAFSTNSILTGSLIRFTNLSGSTIFAKNTLASSGSLKVLGTASGGQLHASNQLRSSGTLSVQGISNLKGAAIFGSTLSLNGVTYTFPGGDGSASGKVLKTNGAGQLAWSSDIDTDTDTNTVTAVGRGLGLTSGVLTLNATITGSLVRFTNLSGSTVFAKNTLASSGSLKVLGTASGGQLHASNQLRSSGTLSIQGAATFKSSSFRLLDSGFANCTALETVDGVLTCGSDGGGTSFVAGQGITLNGANAFSTNAILTGSLIRFTNLSGSTIFAKNTLASSGSLKVLGTASGGQLHASNQLRSSGTLSVQGVTNLKGATIFGSTLSLNGVTYTFPGGDGSASGKVLKTNGAGQLAWSSDIDTDTDTNTVTAVGRGLGLTSGVLTLNSTITGSLVRFTNLSGSTVFAKNMLASSGSLKVLGTASGGQLHASNQLRSSGTLSVQGTANLKGAVTLGSTLSLNGVTYTFPGGDGSASGKVLKTNGAGQLSWSSDIDTDTNTTYTAGEGLSLVGTTFSRIATMTGTSLEIFGTSSGRQVYAADLLRSSGALVVDTTGLFKGNLTTRSTSSGAQVHASNQLRSSGTLSVQGAATFKNSSFRLLDSSFANCTALETVDGVLTCGSDGGGTSFLAGQGINLNGANAFSTNSILTGSLIRFTNLSGSTIFAKNTLASSGSLKVLGTASGGQLHASNQLRSSGTLSVQGTANLKGAVTLGSTLSLNGVTYTFPGGDGSASGKVLKTNGAGQLAWSSDIDTDTDTNTVTAVGRGLGLTSGVLTLNATITGSLVRFTNLSGSTVFAKNTLASSGSLKVLGTASGGQLHASNQLRSSGTLSVQGVSNLKGAAIFGSTLSLNGVTYTFPGGDGSASGKVLKTNSAGQLSWSSDIDTDTNTTYTAGQGLTLNGSNAFSINSTQTGSLLSFTTVSGSRLFAKNILTTSGTLTVKKAAGTATGNILIVDTKGLVYDATTKDVGIGTASPGAKLHVVSKAVNTALLKITASDNSDLFNIDEDVSGNGLVTVRNAAGASVVEMYGLTDGLFSVYKSGVISPKVQFYAGGDSYVNAGNFGVGTITPGSRLSVSGSVIISPLGTLDTIAADAGLAMEIIGAASGRILHAQDQLRSSGSLSIQGAAAFKSSSFTLLDSGFANCTALETSNGVLTCGSDAGGTYAAGQGLTLNGSNAFSTNSILTGSLIRFTNLSGSTIFAKNTLASSGSLKVLGTASGGQLHASNQLRSSGTLTVQGATILRNDLTLGGGNLNFTEGTTIGDGGDALIINSSGTFTVQDILDISDNNMVNVGDIALDSLSSDAGASISVALGSDPGDDFIVDTTGLVYEGDTNRVGIGTAAPKTTLEIIGTASGIQIHARDKLLSSGSLVVAGAARFKSSSFTLLDSGFANCTALETADGVLTCGSDGGTTYVAGQGLTLNGSNAFSTNSILTGSLIRFTNLSGSTIFAKNTLASSGSLKVLGTASGGQLHASNQLRSSGTLSIQGITNLKGAAIFGSTLSLNGVTYTFPGGDGSASGKVLKTNGAGQLAWSTDLNTGGGSSFGTGNTLTIGDSRYVRKSGDTMTGALIINPSSDAIQLNVKASALQLLDTMVIESNFGTDWLVVQANGDVQTTQALLVNGTLSTSNTAILVAKPLAIGGVSALAYNAISDSGTTSHGTINFEDIGADNDLYIEGALEVDGSVYFDGGFEVFGTGSGSIFHASTQLRSSGGLIVQTTGLFKGNLTTRGVLSGSSLVVSGGTKTYSGIVIQRSSGAKFLTLRDADNSKAVGIYSGSGSPWNKILAATGSFYLDNNRGNAYLNVAGGDKKAWRIVQLGTGSGSTYPDRADLWHQNSTVTAGNASSCTQDVNEMYDIFCGPGTPAQNDAFTNGFFLRAGTYTFSTMGLTSNNKGSIDWYIDGTSVVSAQDWYSVTGTYNVVKTATVTVTGNGYHVLRGIVSTKNASSSNYAMLLTKMWFVPTSDNTHTSPGADYAEWFRATPDATGSLPQKGDLVCVDVTAPNTVRKCENEADSNVMGIVSTSPSFIGNDHTFDGVPIPGTVLVGLIGQIPAKVIVESGSGGGLGAIRPGDSLTPASRPGYARKAMAGEATVGVALEGLESGEGLIQVLVARRNGSLTADAVSDRVLQTIKDLKIEDELKLALKQTVEQFSASGTLLQPISDEVERQLQQQISTLGMGSVTDRLAALEARMATMSGGIVPSAETEPVPSRAEGSSALTSENLSLSGSLTAQELRAQTLSLEENLAAKEGRFAGDLYVDGVFHVRDLYVPNGVRIDGGLHAAALEVQSGAVINGTLTLNSDLNVTKSINFASGSVLSAHDLIVRGALHVVGPVTIDGLAQFLGDVEIKGQLTLSNRQAGFAEIPQTGTSVTIVFEPPLNGTPVVTASPDVPLLYAVSRATATGFVIRLSAPAAERVGFSWTALTAVDPQTALGHAAADGPEPLPFLVDGDGIPLSEDEAWNSCIRNHPLLTADGSPISCGGYHDAYVWEHPDLHINFTWNTSMTPPLLQLPEGFVVERAEAPAVSDESSSSSSDSSSSAPQSPEAEAESSSSSEDASSSSSAASDDSSSSSSSSDSSDTSSSAASESSESSDSDEASSASSSDSGETSSASSSDDSETSSASSEADGSSSSSDENFTPLTPPPGEDQ